MSANATTPNISSTMPQDALDVSTNGTQTVPTPLFEDVEFLFISLQVMLSAMGIIWLGSHASLRRPPSAAPAKRAKGSTDKKEEKFAEGLVASDAIMFPVLAGAVLIGLYYLIQWLQDPDILNKILRAYMSVMSIACLGKLCADGTSVVTTLVFPSKWADYRGKLYNVDAQERMHYEIDVASGEKRAVAQKKSPLPSPLGDMLPNKVNSFLWELRHLFMEEWTVRLAAHGFGSGKTKVKLDTLVGALVAVGIIIAYYMTNWVMLSNLLGTALSYSSFTMMSPTSFAIGTMVLAGLFVYDIVMVFYTPYMVTVATNLDVPIKLVYQGTGGRSSMLGLGDIVIPGIFIALALRFDLYQYYQKKIKLVPTELVSESATETPGQTVQTTETQHRKVKEAFVDPRGQWGDFLWTVPARKHQRTPVLSSFLPSPGFPKPYFWATMMGYFLGMAFTLTMLLVFNHGQPALLYLVPGVTGSVWLTGLWRGELKDMWTYTEDGTLDTEDVVVEVDAEGNVVKKTAPSDAETKTVDESEDKKQATVEKTPRVAGDYDVFLFSVTAPRYVAPKED